MVIYTLSWICLTTQDIMGIMENWAMMDITAVSLCEKLLEVAIDLDLLKEPKKNFRKRFPIDFL